MTVTSSMADMLVRSAVTSINVLLDPEGARLLTYSTMSLW